MDDTNNPAAPAVDDQFLSAMGLDGLEGDQKQKALEDILVTLNMNVGNRVAETLNEDQLKDFDNLTAKEDVNEEELSQWLSQNVPNYQQLIEEEAQKMKQQNQSIVDQVMGPA